MSLMLPAMPQVYHMRELRTCISLQMQSSASSPPDAKSSSPGESMPAYLARMNGLLAQVEQEHQQVYPR